MLRRGCSTAIGLLLFACRPPAAPAPEPPMSPTSDAPPAHAPIAPPWQLDVADGNGNLHRCGHEVGAAAQYAYVPVTAETSSSGHYDGGPPRQGTIADDRIEPLWRAVATLCADASVQIAERRKGTVAIAAVGPVSCDVIVDGAAAADLLELLVALP
ncbi:MAG: hypothetical protein KBB21_34050 [Nannocystaceae bacterium]|nr:hypothetical protein [Deltaproteobacteria bacterium]MBP7291702.1 hypothetical protein [Nannocystaceae bacterium]